MVSDSLPHLLHPRCAPTTPSRCAWPGEVKSKGDLLADFEPPSSPPRRLTIPRIPSPRIGWTSPGGDPRAVKPGDWDGDAPRGFPTRTEKPEGWLDDEPAEVEDPSAEQPEDWDEDEDGTWEGAHRPQPQVRGGARVRRVEAPRQAHPDYKGKWYPPLVDNPAYKGPWAPRKIPNPNTTETRPR